MFSCDQEGVDGIFAKDSFSAVLAQLIISEELSIKPKEVLEAEISALIPDPDDVGLQPDKQVGNIL